MTSLLRLNREINKCCADMSQQSSAAILIIDTSKVNEKIRKPFLIVGVGFLSGFLLQSFFGSKHIVTTGATMVFGATLRTLKYSLIKKLYKH